MKSIIETFAPAGCEERLAELLKERFAKKFDTIRCDSMGNVIAVSGNGSLCIECGMDSTGVMVVSFEEQGVRFAPVGNVKTADIVGRNVAFCDGTVGEVCCDDEKSPEDAKLSDLYIDVDCHKVKIGDFGVIVSEFCEDDFSYTALGLKNKIALCALCKAVEESGKIQDTTLVISAQKCLGGRGIRGFFGANSFGKIVTLDYFEGEECAIIAKDENTVSNPEMRKKLETMVNDDIKTVIADKNFSLNLFAMTCGDPCTAFGIPVSCTAGEPDKVSKKDFDTAVRFLTMIFENYSEN